MLAGNSYSAAGKCAQDVTDKGPGAMEDIERTSISVPEQSTLGWEKFPRCVQTDQCRRQGLGGRLGKSAVRSPKLHKDPRCGHDTSTEDNNTVDATLETDFRSSST